MFTPSHCEKRKEIGAYLKLYFGVNHIVELKILLYRQLKWLSIFVDLRGFGSSLDYKLILSSGTRF